MHLTFHQEELGSTENILTQSCSAQRKRNGPTAPKSRVRPMNAGPLPGLTGYLNCIKRRCTVRSCHRHEPSEIGPAPKGA